MEPSQPLRAPESADADDAGSSPSSDEPPQPESQHQVEITDAFSLIDHDTAAWLEEHARRAMRAAGVSGELRVALLRDAEMAEAHERHCGAPGTTDVITFDLSESDTLDVDVFVCVDEAHRQAARREIPVRRELLLYIVHAMLHCTGYNDKSEQDAARMHEREDELLTMIGVGPVYYLPDNRERA